MGLLIYLDNCCFNRPYDDQSQVKIRLETEAKLYIQSQINSNDLSLAWSYILDYENGRNPYPQRMEAICRWKSLATSYVVESLEIKVRARLLVEKGLGTFDALHLACSVAGGASVFLTCDNGILRKRSILEIPLRISSPLEFLEQGEDL